MKIRNIYLVSLLSMGQMVSAQAADIMTESFETDGSVLTGDGRYTVTAEFNDGNSDHWGRTDGSDVGNISGPYSAIDGTFFWAAEDVDDAGGNGLSTQTMEFIDIDITGFENLAFTGLFGAGNENAPGSSAYDAGDVFKVEYRIDGSGVDAYSDGVCFSYEAAPGDTSNEPIGLDADCDGESDGIPGRLGTALLQHGFSIAGTGNNLDLLVTVSMNSGNEEVAFDNLILTGDISGADNPPQVSSTSPIDTAIDVALDSNVLLNFDETVDIAINAIEISCSSSGLQNFPAAPAAAVMSIDINPTDFDFAEICTVTVDATGVTDNDGLPDQLDGDGNGTGGDNLVFSFTVDTGDVAPSVDSTVPMDAATDVLADSTITINFDELVDATVNAVTITCDAAAQTFTGLPFSGTSMVLTPDADLPFDASCAVAVLAAEVTDQDGTIDNMAMDFSFGFTVESVPAVINLIINEYQADPDATNGDANGDGNVDTSEDEFVEIYNDSADPVDMSGWTLSDAVAVRHTFAPGTILDGCRTIVVFGGGTPTGAFGGSQTAVASEGFLGLNNGGDSIIINDGVTDQVNLAYGAAGTNQSYTLDPDVTGLTFVEHSGATGSAGALFSPGTKINGGTFIPCDGSPTPPRVNNTIPSNGSGGVDLATNIEVNFSENVNASISAATLTCGLDVISFSGLPLVDVAQLIINPDANLPNGQTCTLELIATEITDLDDVADQLDGNGDLIAGDNFTMSFIAGFPEVEIYEIQGTGLTSPYNGLTVITSDNIVTALDTNGFYMQTADANDDADPATSSGIYVYTQSAPTVSVGDQVDLRGEIVEFFGLTEFTNPNDYILTINSSDNALPTAIILDVSFPSTDPTVFPCGDVALGYECYEGMYFEMPQGFVSAASVATFFAGSDANDVYVNAGTSRAFREPGIDFPGLPGLPIFDGNPELIEMSIEALTLPFQPLAAGSEIALKGVISYGFGDYELQPSELTMINENVIPSSVRDATIDEFTLASANIQRFFDPIDDPGSEDDDQIADPIVYANRLLKLADYVVNDLKSPAIIGLQEIENLNVLADLIAAISTAGGPTYVAELLDGNDQGGIDVAYLYQADMLSKVAITQLGLNELNTFDSSLLHDRPPLWLSADVTDGGIIFPINVLVVHMRSRGGIDDNTDGERVRSKRLQQANSVAVMADGILSNAQSTPLYVIGDFNAFEFSDGYVDVVGQITGEALEAENLVWSEPLFVKAPLTQAVHTLADDQQYSFVFRGSAQILDNALMNDVALMNFNEIQFVRGQSDANINFEDDSTSLRSTDHDGFVLFIQVNDDLIFKDGFE